MKYKILIAFFLLLSAVCSAQLQFPSAGGSPTTVPTYQGGVKGKLYSFISIKDTLNNAATIYPGAMTIRPQDTIGHATFPIYQTNGVYWTKVSSSTIIVPGVDSVTVYGNQLCQWQGGTATCYFLTPSSGGSTDSLHLNYDSLYILQYRNGTLIDSIFLLHTYLYVDPAHFSLTDNYLGNPYAQLLNATGLVDSTYLVGDSLITRYADGHTSSTFNGGGSGGSQTLQQVFDVETGNAQLNKDDTITLNSTQFILGDLFGGNHNGVLIDDGAVSIRAAINSSGSYGSLQTNTDGSSSNFYFQANRATGKSSNIFGYSDAIVSTLTVSADSIALASTLSGASNGYVWTLNNTSTGGGFWASTGITPPSSSFTWSVLDSLNAPPVSPTTGDIYEVGTIPSGAWVGHAGDIATWGGASWTFEDATIGNLLYNTANDITSKFNGTVWVRTPKIPIVQGSQALGAAMIIGTSDNQNLSFRTNGFQRFLISNAGAIAFSSLAGTGNAVMQLSSTGVASRGAAPLSLTTTGSSGAATYSPTTGVLNVPQYSGGATDTSGFVHKLYSLNETVTGRKTMNAQFFLNKDSTTNTTGLSTVLVLDITTNQVKRQESIVVNLSSVQNNDILSYNSGTTQWNNHSFGTYGWSVLGNSGMQWNVNYLGTSDAQTLRFRTNAIERAKIDSTGKMFIDSKYIGSGIGANYGSIGFGDGALLAVTTGNNNTAIGDSAGISLTTGNFNTAVGSQALMASTVGQYMVAVGYQALKNNTTGLGYGVAIGYQAQLNNNTGNDNVAVGFQAVQGNTTGTENIGLGYQAVYFNQTGLNNVGVGTNTLHGNANFSNSTAVGHSALFNNTASNNTAIGYQALYGNTSATENVAIGYNSMYANALSITGSYNTAVGSQAMISNRTGAYNVAIGRVTLFNSIESNNTIAIGSQAGQYSYRIVDGAGSPNDPLQKADTSVLIGNVASPALDSQTNQIVIATWNGRGIGSHTIMLGDSMNIATGIFGRVSIASTTISVAAASAQLDVSSTTKGFLPPRMTTTQKNAIISPAEGLVVYDTILHKLTVFTGTVWETVTSL